MPLTYTRGFFSTKGNSDFMARYTPQNIGSGLGSTTKINENFDNIETAINDSLSRRPGDTPNAMETDIDMNSHKLLNVEDGVVGSDGINLSQAKALVADINTDKIFDTVTGPVITTSQILTSNLTDIDRVVTTGYLSQGDGGGCVWNSTGVTSIPDAGSTDLPNGLLYDLVGNQFKISCKVISTKAFGSTDGESTQAIQSAIQFVNSQGGGKVILEGDCTYNSTIYLLSDVCLEIVSGASLRPEPGLGDTPGTGLFVTLACLGRNSFSTGKINFKNKLSSYQGPHTNVKIIQNGTIEGTLSSSGTHDVADAACIHVEDFNGFDYIGGQSSLIENCDGAPIRVDGTGAVPAVWTTLALADTNTTIGHSENYRIHGLRFNNVNYGFEAQNYPKNGELVGFKGTDSLSHGIRLTSFRDVVSHSHHLEDIGGSRYWLNEGQQAELFGAKKLQGSDQIAIQVGEVDNIHIYGNNITSGQLSHLGAGPNAGYIQVVNNVWGDENDEYATANGLINPTNIDNLVVRDILPTNAAKTQFRQRNIGAYDSVRAYLSANQTAITPGSFTKVAFDTVDFSDGDSYSTVDYNMTPSTGRYLVQGKLQVQDNIVDQQAIFVSLFKNGFEHSQTFVRASGTSSQLVDFSFYVDISNGNTLDIRVDPGGTGDKSIVSGSTKSIIEIIPIS